MATQLASASHYFIESTFVSGLMQNRAVISNMRYAPSALGIYSCVLL